jgi:uncharacterized protein DUF190
VTIPTEGKLLRIFVGEADHWHGKPLYEAIVLEARKRGLAGATVIKGFMGFGAHSRIHTAKLLGCLRISRSSSRSSTRPETSKRSCRILKRWSATASSRWSAPKCSCTGRAGLRSEICL